MPASALGPALSSSTWGCMLPCTPTRHASCTRTRACSTCIGDFPGVPLTCVRAGLSREHRASWREGPCSGLTPCRSLLSRRTMARRGRPGIEPCRARRFPEWRYKLGDLRVSRGAGASSPERGAPATAQSSTGSPLSGRIIDWEEREREHLERNTERAGERGTPLRPYACRVPFSPDGP